MIISLLNKLQHYLQLHVHNISIKSPMAVSIVPFGCFLKNTYELYIIAPNCFFELKLQHLLNLELWFHAPLFRSEALK